MLTDRQFEERLDEIHQILSEMNKNAFAEQFIDNEEFASMLGISKRTAQTWREEGLIGYAQLGKKIYYRLSDIYALFAREYVPATARAKKRSLSAKLKINPKSNGWRIRAGKTAKLHFKG